MIHYSEKTGLSTVGGELVVSCELVEYAGEHRKLGSRRIVMNTANSNKPSQPLPMVADRRSGGVAIDDGVVRLVESRAPGWQRGTAAVDWRSPRPTIRSSRSPAPTCPCTCW